MYKIGLRVSPNLLWKGELGDMAAEEDSGLAQIGSQSMVAVLLHSRCDPPVSGSPHHTQPPFKSLSAVTQTLALRNFYLFPKVADSLFNPFLPLETRPRIPP